MVRFGRILRWIILFIAIVAALWLPIQSNTAPQIILLVVVYVITLNFSIPLTVGYNSAAPLVAIISLWALDVETALLTAAIGLPLAELVRPFWNPLRKQIDGIQVARRQRFVLVIGLFVALLTTGFLFQQPSGNATPVQSWLTTLGSDSAIIEPVVTTLFLLLIYNLTFFGLWLASRQKWLTFVTETGLYTLALLLITLPLAATLATTAIDLPVLVLLCIAIAGAALISWTWWRQRYLMARRIREFAALNRVGAKLRETLDYAEVLDQTYAMVRTLIPTADGVAIVLRHDDGHWEQAVPVRGIRPNAIQPFAPDDFTRHVIDRNKTLELDSDNLHFATIHNLTPPTPTPNAWLGVPLSSAERVTGALVVQKTERDDPFTRWDRELLLAIAGQASAAIQNARLYGETVRLYNLTDEALARRVEQLQALLNATTDGVLMIDRNRQIVLINPAASTLLGRQAQQAHARTIDVNTVAARLGYEPESLESTLTKLQRGEYPDPTRVQFALNGDENRRFVERETVPISAENDQLMGWLIILRDVTEERERAEWRADLTRMIVHDLRNPVTTLSSTVNQIEQKLPPELQENLTDLLFYARRGCDNMLEMIDSMMDINQAESGNLIADPDAIHITRLTQRVFDYMQPMAQQRSISLICDHAADLPPAWADEELTRRIVTNLLDNALKFTPAGGQVRGVISAEAPLPGHEPGNRITIYDSGPGVPTGMRQRIFERFITFNRGGGQVRGTGLGLSFCKLAVESQGGRIWVEDAPEGGSAFAFTVPGIPQF
jgi:PAS domain S-box-containing protein